MLVSNRPNGTRPPALLAVVVAHTSRARPRIVYSGSFMSPRHILVVSLVRPADPSSPGVSFRPSSLASPSHHSHTFDAGAIGADWSDLGRLSCCGQAPQNIPSPLPHKLFAHIPCTAPCLCPQFMPSLHCRVSSRHSCEVLLTSSPLACLLTHGYPSTSPVACSCQAVQARGVRKRAQGSPDLRSAVYEAPVIAPAPQHRVVPSTLQTFGAYTPRHVRRQAPPNPPILLSLAFVHILRIQLPTLTRVSHRL